MKGEVAGWAVKSASEALKVVNCAVERILGDKAPERKLGKDAEKALAVGIYETYKQQGGEPEKENELRTQLERALGEVEILERRLETAIAVRDSLHNTCRRLGEQLDEARMATFLGQIKESGDQ